MAAAPGNSFLKSRLPRRARRASHLGEPGVVRRPVLDVVQHIAKRRSCRWTAPEGVGRRERPGPPRGSPGRLCGRCRAAGVDIDCVNLAGMEGEAPREIAGSRSISAMVSVDSGERHYHSCGFCHSSREGSSSTLRTRLRMRAGGFDGTCPNATAGESDMPCAAASWDSKHIASSLVDQLRLTGSHSDRLGSRQHSRIRRMLAGGSHVRCTGVPYRSDIQP